MQAARLEGSIGRRRLPTGDKRLLLAGHIKPGRTAPLASASIPQGLAACAAHDVAFDTRMLTVNGWRIHLARRSLTPWRTTS